MSAMVSQRPCVCLLDRLFMRRSKKTSKPLAFMRGIHRWPVNSLHKGPVTRQNVFIWWRHHDGNKPTLILMSQTTCSPDFVLDIEILGPLYGLPGWICFLFPTNYLRRHPHRHHHSRHHKDSIKTNFTNIAMISLAAWYVTWRVLTCWTCEWASTADTFIVASWVSGSGSLTYGPMTSRSPTVWKRVECRGKYSALSISRDQMLTKVTAYISPARPNYGVPFVNTMTKIL